MATRKQSRTIGKRVIESRELKCHKDTKLQMTDTPDKVVTNKAEGNKVFGF